MSSHDRHCPVMEVVPGRSSSYVMVMAGCSCAWRPLPGAGDLDDQFAWHAAIAASASQGVVGSREPSGTDRDRPSSSSKSATDRAVAAMVQRSDGHILCVMVPQYGWDLPGSVVLPEDDGDLARVAGRAMRETSLELVACAPMFGIPVVSYRGVDAVSYVHVVRALRCRGIARGVDEGHPVAWFSVEEFLDATPDRDRYVVLRSLGASSPTRIERERWNPDLARQLLSELPDELVWDADGFDAGRVVDSADYVDGFNDGVACAMPIAAQLSAALVEIDELSLAARGGTPTGDAVRETVDDAGAICRWCGRVGCSSSRHDSGQDHQT